ncbi:hypothetical protein PORY_002542 [Pneumocystis oryctolagi]|uniref:Uncharacterized protein n=1 Tax=Pneumocystis oryctolagi TaxID=42067 RepID=A0ACB7CB25_9ASCO|nr:hypothetical protein PORY_002542 [Pneumocystis oryctolagi]
MPVLRKARSFKGFSQEKEPSPRSSASSTSNSSNLFSLKPDCPADFSSINKEIIQISNTDEKIVRQRALSTSSFVPEALDKGSFGKEIGVSKNKTLTIPSTINLLTDTFGPLLPAIINTAKPAFSALLPSLSEPSIYKNYFFKSSKKEAGSLTISDHMVSKPLPSHENFHSLGYSISSSVFNMFHPLQKSFSSFDIKHIGTKDMYINNTIDDAWLLLCMKILPLFNGEGLLVPVENLNNLIRLHIKKRCIEKKMGLFVKELRGLIETGIKCFDANLISLSDEKMVLRLVELWSFFFGTVLPYIEAIFLPLQTEFDDLEQDVYSYGKIIQENDIDLNVRRITLIGFRDNIVLPLYERLKAIFLKIPLNLDINQTLTDTASKLLQSILILVSVRSSDEKQKKMDNLVKILCNNWFKSERVGRDRRGFIAIKDEFDPTISTL